MPFGRNQRLDPRRSSQYCSTTTIAVFVALCLVGVWMMTSSTVVPVDVSNANSEVKQDLSETDAKPLKDSKDSGDASINMDASTSDSLSEPSAEKIEVESVKQNGAITAEGENSLQDGEDNKDVPTDTSKSEEYNDANGTPEGGEMVKEGGDATAGDKKNNEQQKSMEQNFDGAEKKQMKNSPANKEQERNTAQHSDEKENTDQSNSSQNSNATLNDEQQQSDTENNPVQDENGQGQIQVDQSQDKNSKKGSGKKDPEGLENEDRSSELLPSGSQLELLNETNMQTGAWSTQADESKNEKDVQTSLKVNFSWKLCNVSGGADYIPCLDNVEAIQKLTSTKHYEHRERHCPEVPPTCLVPLPGAYKIPIEWPSSRDKIWYHNVPHTQLAAIKGHQNWVKVSGEYITFPGGGTQFKHGALHYIDVIQEAMPDISWGKRSRVVLDVGCGVASFGGYLFDRDVLTMSLAPKDEHEAQVQFALERGIPAISAVMGTKRLPFPGRAFDVIHCARCRVPWHIEGGMLLLELNRLLRPGGYFVWSATPVYRNDTENAEIWRAMKELTTSLCWEMVVTAKDEEDQVGLAIFRMPSNNSCYEKRKQSTPPFCQKFDDPNAAWNVPLQACMHKLPADPSARGAKWPEQWPLRLEKAPYWLNSSQIGVFGKPAPDDFTTDQEHWNNVVRNSYANGMGIDWSKVRNVMDMRSVYGGFAAALRDRKLWVMNIVPTDSPDTLPIIYERGLFGMYHDWCESFSTYPRTYDLLHADHLFSSLKKRCKLSPVIVEVDRILRPQGKLIVRDSVDMISEVEKIARSLKWEIRMSFSKQNEGILCVMKTMWRPQEVVGITSPKS